MWPKLNNLAELFGSAEVFSNQTVHLKSLFSGYRKRVPLKLMSSAEHCTLFLSINDKHYHHPPDLNISITCLFLSEMAPRIYLL